MSISARVVRLDVTATKGYNLLKMVLAVNVLYFF